MGVRSRKISRPERRRPNRDSGDRALAVSAIPRAAPPRCDPPASPSPYGFPRASAGDRAGTYRAGVRVASPHRNGASTSGSSMRPKNQFAHSPMRVGCPGWYRDRRERLAAKRLRSCRPYTSQVEPCAGSLVILAPLGLDAELEVEPAGVIGHQLPMRLESPPLCVAAIVIRLIAVILLREP